MPARTPYEALMRKIAAAVLIVGLSVSALLFATAPHEEEENVSGVYVASVDNSKKYQLELERIGGKAAVVSAQFMEWFDSLWHGRALAGTVAVLSAGIALLCFLAGKLPPLDD
jgi:hypothetical protein